MKINLTENEWLAVLQALELSIDDQNYAEKYESDDELAEGMRKNAEAFDDLHAKISEQLYRRETYAERFIREYGELYADPEVRKHGEGREVASMELTPDRKFVIVHWIGGAERKVHVAGDSVSAMVYDIDRQAF